jgi:hypothetical protein
VADRVGISARSAARLRRVVETVEAEGRGRVPRDAATRLTSVELHVVQATSTTKTFGRQPGTRYDYDPGERGKTEGETIWLDPINDETIRTGTYFWAKLVGVRTLDDVRIYSPLFFPRAFDFRCSDDELHRLETTAGLEFPDDPEVVSCCDATCSDPCVDDCDADDLGATLCAEVTTALWPGVSVGMKAELTEGSPNEWSGSSADLTISTFTPFTGNGGNNCGLYTVGGTFAESPGVFSGFAWIESCSPLVLKASIGNPSSLGQYAVLTITDGDCLPDGSGSGGCTAPVDNVCCEDIPCELIVTPSGKTGAFTDLPTQFSAVYHDGGDFDGWWVSDDLELCSEPIFLAFRCVADGGGANDYWQYVLFDEAASVVWDFGSISSGICSPLQLEALLSAPEVCGLGAGQFYLLASE